MKRVLAIMLLLGAVFGLLGLQTAAAAASLPDLASPSVSPMSAHCMEMMGVQQPDSAKACNGVTLNCIFATGCAVPLMHEPVGPIASAPIRAPELFWIATAVLVGSDRSPEIHPPTLLG